MDDLLTDRPDSLMTNEHTLANARLILPDSVMRGSVRFGTDGITDIVEGAHIPSGAEDCHGDYVAPGLIELHTDNLERHIQPRPKVAWPFDAAIAAHDAELASTGITTVFDAMRVGSIPSGRGRYLKYARELSRALLNMRATKSLKISHFLHLRAEICSETLIEEMSEFGSEDRVGLVSLMDHTPGQRQFRDFSKFKAYVMGKNSLSEEEFADHVERLEGLQRSVGVKHELAAVNAARRYGAVLASHDDTTLEHVEMSAKHGVSLAEFPTTREAAQTCRELGIAIMMGAPNLIRGGSHSGNVAARDLAESDLLDILSSDYVPAALLMAAVQLGDLWGDMARGLGAVTHRPAQAVGLDDRGALEIGKRADLVRFRQVGNAIVTRGVWAQGRQVG